MKVAASEMQGATISIAELSVTTGADVKRQSFTDSVDEPSVTESFGETAIISNAEESLAIDDNGELSVAASADVEGLSAKDDVDEPLLPEKTDGDKTAADVVDEQFVICNAKELLATDGVSKPPLAASVDAEE